MREMSLNTVCPIIIMKEKSAASRRYPSLDVLVSLISV